MKSLTALLSFMSFAALKPAQGLAFGFGGSKARVERIPQLLREIPSSIEQDCVQAKMQTRRKMILSSFALFPVLVGACSSANARVVLNDDGDYEEVPEEDWQTTWKQRLDKANSMSKDEIFNAARGAGNLQLKDGEESDASRKRRAMSACRDSNLRSKAGVNDAKTCNNRVMIGDSRFILDQL
jgi:hypothetical protein